MWSKSNYSSVRSRQGFFCQVVAELNALHSLQPFLHLLACFHQNMLTNATFNSKYFLLNPTVGVRMETIVPLTASVPVLFTEGFRKKLP